jgi:Fe2+ or Zn2+ uptake regulation protein
MNEEEELLKLIEPTKEDLEERIKRRLKHRTFARVLIYIYIKEKKGEHIYPNDLAETLKSISNPRAWQILNEMEKLGIVKKIKVGGLIAFKLISLNSIEEWVEKAKETLRYK